jgi:23S rRNA (cytidine1920-2'-O)/16S rRNA (cytidine1409-2'-O)-methyltransferase
VGKKGIVRDTAVHGEVIRNVIAYGRENGLIAENLMSSPIKGAKGNVEFLLLLRKMTACDIKAGSVACDENEANSPMEEGADERYNGITEARIKEVVESERPE